MRNLISAYFRSLFLAVFICALFSLAYAANETITVTTYYPSPYGAFNNLYVANRTGVGTTDPGQARLTVENGTISHDDNNVFLGGNVSNITCINLGVNSTVGANTGNCVIAGGDNNTVDGEFAAIGGGSWNSALAHTSFIRGGYNNYLVNGTAPANYSVIGGGYNNSMRGLVSAIGGGRNNAVGSGLAYAAVLGGYSNNITSNYSVIGGGYNNVILEDGTGNNTIGGGCNNDATGYLSVVAGGRNNNATGYVATVGSGSNNNASFDGGYNTVSGGSNNTAAGIASFVGGGMNNSAMAENTSVIAGGHFNVVTATGNYSVVGGGYNNTASGNYSNSTYSHGTNTIGGGMNNFVHESYNTIVGGKDNTNVGFNSVIGGGWNNSVSWYDSAVIGGHNNNASGSNQAVVVAGGENNRAINSGAVIVGGQLNNVTGEYSWAGGNAANADSSYSFVWGAGTAHGSGTFNVNSPNGVYFGTTNQTCYYDVAEAMDVSKDNLAQQMELVSFYGEDLLGKSMVAYDQNLAGVISSEKTATMHLATSTGPKPGTQQLPVSLAGRCFVKVCAESGNIELGDAITSSSIPGIGMKAAKSGKIIGYAMQKAEFKDSKEIKEILVFIKLDDYVCPEDMYKLRKT